MVKELNCMWGCRENKVTVSIAVVVPERKKKLGGAMATPAPMKIRPCSDPIRRMVTKKKNCKILVIH
jgi:hypothetical protein